MMSQREKIRRRRRYNENDKLYLTIDIRTGKGERIFNSKERRIDEVFPVLLKILKFNYKIDPQKMLEKKDNDGL